MKARIQTPPVPTSVTSLHSFRSLILGLLCAAAPATPVCAAQDDAADATGLESDAVDPLGWVGAHEIEFVAKVARDGIDLRSGPDPHYRSVLQVDRTTPLVVVARTNDHLAVLVPSGYPAFVHGRYVEVDELGIGRITTSRVNLRSAPSSQGDYPIGQVDAGAEVWVWGPAEENEKWLRVTAPTSLPLWVAAADVAPAGAIDDEAVLAGITAALDVRRRAFEERTAEARAVVAARHEAEAARVATLASADELLNSLEEVRRRGAEADFAAARERVTALEDTDDVELTDALATVMQRIETYEMERDRERERLALLARIEEQKDRLEAERLELLAALEDVGTEKAAAVGTVGEWAGFVRIRPFGGKAMKAFAIEKGTAVAAWVTSPDGRYRLSDYAGRSMKIHGRVVAQEGERPIVEITRLEQVVR